jgi:hypothetical protein
VDKKKRKKSDFAYIETGTGIAVAILRTDR